jgi:pimeloyl-ACP methyl ester carboxylesterase
MSKRKTKSKRRIRSTAAADRRPSGESRSGDAATVAWTVSVTTVLLCDVGAMLALLYAARHPDLRSVAMLGQLLLFAGAVVGFLSLSLLPIVFRLRRTPPPRGLTVFAVCTAAAPLLAVLVRAMR